MWFDVDAELAKIRREAAYTKKASTPATSATPATRAAQVANVASVAAPGRSAGADATCDVADVAGLGINPEIKRCRVNSSACAQGLARGVGATSATPATRTGGVAKIADVAGTLCQQSLETPQNTSRPGQKDDGMFRHGRSASGKPLTWTGRPVRADEWPDLSSWERHGPDGRIWCGHLKAWVTVNTSPVGGVPKPANQANKKGQNHAE
jgi:hypothetical protein